MGQQAELNAKKAGKERMQMLAEAGGGGGKEVPWWRDGSVEGLPRMDKPLNLDGVKDLQKYVEVGEKS